MDIEYIKWADHNADNSWACDANINPSLIESIGFVVKENKQMVSICTSRDFHDNDVNTCRMNIIKACIVERYTIEYKDVNSSNSK